jgi:hypothetical protein
VKWLKEKPSTRTCTTCKEVLPLADFPKSKKEKWGHDYRCPRCTNRRRTALNLKTLYGLTFEQYFKKLESQSYRCVICYKHQTEVQRPFHVDHDHITGENRALLCSQCNVAFGMLRERPYVLQNMLKYCAEYNPSKNTRQAA